MYSGKKLQMTIDFVRDIETIIRIGMIKHSWRIRIKAPKVAY